MTLDPALFRPEAIDPETAAFNAQLETMFASMAPPYTRDVKELRAERATRGPMGPIVRSDNAKVRTVDGPAGAVSLRMFLPSRVEGVYLHIHGGGWVLGASDQQDPALEAIAEKCEVAVLSVEYRLAPEHPYPAGPDDCETAAVWLAKNARSEFGTDRLIIAGDSAGAHLAVVSLLRLRDRHGVRPFVGANLTFGVYDVDGTPSCRAWGERYLVLNAPIMRWFGDSFVPPEKRRDPDVSPLYADLSGLPPALFSVGTLDPLVDDTLFMHARWLAAGNEAELGVYPGGVHGFTAQPTPVGRSAVARQHAFIKDVVAAKAATA